MPDKKHTILIVDDYKDNLDLLSAILQYEYRVLCARGGQQCLDMVQQEIPDLILLDVQMPILTGFDVLKKLRSNTVTEKVPVIILTAAYRDPKSIEEGFRLGADEYLTKPIETAELIVRVRSTLRMVKAEREIEHLKQEYMSMLVHDLRSPLQVIVISADLLRSGQGGELTSEQNSYVKNILSTSKDLLEHINDLLDLSRLEKLPVELSRQNTDPVYIAHSVLERMKILAERNQITLSENLDRNIAMVMVDPNKLEQVIMNLLSNAIKFTPEGGLVKLSAKLSDHYLTISISDTGPGIPLEEQHLIFDKYKQLQSTQLTKHKGTGLGLAICRAIVEAHGGKIWVESEIGLGSTFYFTIPIQDKAH